LADNKLPLNAGWDEDLMAEELKALLLTDDLGVDIGVTGFQSRRSTAWSKAWSRRSPAIRRMTGCPTRDRSDAGQGMSGSWDPTG
jgi:hypothetical protein